MKNQLQTRLEDRVKQYVSMNSKRNDCVKVNVKKDLLDKRSAKIVKVKATGKALDERDSGEETIVDYNIHFQYFIKQNGFYYIEEEVEHRQASFYKGVLVEDVEREVEFRSKNNSENDDFNPVSEDIRISFQYDRLKAVQYAEKWWNSYNPKYKKFEVDCTNFISQCLHEGGAPMQGSPNRSKGWWMQNNHWSYSWSVAHSFRWYLPGAKVGLRGREVSSPDELMLGDVICYDFQGDGRFDHNTIVTAKDDQNMPLVNAHTYNSRMRYWSYEDSTAYTPNIKYKFFRIVDDR